MSNAILPLAVPTNEPVRSYAPGSPEKKSLKKRLTEMGAIVSPLNGKQFGDYIRTEMTKWAAIVEKAGVKPE